MIFSMIVAASENNVIGLNGDMPWGKMQGDLRYFKKKTSGHWCILGRKTFNALGNQVLPGRKFIVVTRDKSFDGGENSIIVNRLDDALHHEVLDSEEEVFILGGGEIFSETMKVTSRIYLTRIYASFKGDTFFPEPDSEEWKLVSVEKHLADDKNPHDYDFLVYERK